MRRTGSALAIALVGMCMASPASGQDAGELDNEDIVTLTEAGHSAAAIVAAIETSATDFDASEAQPGQSFFDALSSGGRGPEMVVIPAGRFRMGCVSSQDCDDEGMTIHEATIPAAFAMSKYEITFEDYDRYTHPDLVDDEGWGRGRRPVINVSWNDAQDYVEWLSGQTGHAYRLLSEAEWKYVARAGSSMASGWGMGPGSNRANCIDWYCEDQWETTAPAGSFAANAFGVHDMHGNVWEWLEDCWNESYGGAPSDGSAWISGDCEWRILIGGSWNYTPWGGYQFRRGFVPEFRFNSLGFRVARTLAP